MGLFDWLTNTPARVARRLEAALIAGDGDAFKLLDGVSGPSRWEALDLAAKGLIYEEQYEAAAIVCSYAAALDPTALLERRITLFRITEQPEKELAALESALQSRPRSPDLRERCATLLTDFGRPEEALALLDAAPAEDAVLNLARARVLLDLARPAEARALVAPIVAELRGALNGAFDEDYRLIQARLVRALELVEEIDDAFDACPPRDSSIR